MAILTKSILVLEDGKISAFDFHNKETYIQPEIIVNTLDAIQQITMFGQFRETVNIDTTIQEIDGVAFAGNFAALETALRLAAKKANGLAVGGVGGGGGGDASAANQLLEIAELQAINANNLAAETTAFLTTSLLASGASFSSGVLDASGRTQVQTEINASHDGTIDISFCSDAAGLDVVRSLSIPYIAANGYQFFAAPAFVNFIKYEFTNNAGVTQTDFYYTTKFLTTSLSPQLLTTNAFIASAMVASLGRNIIVGQTGAGNFENCTVVEHSNASGTYNSLQVATGARPSELAGRTAITVLSDNETAPTLLYTVTAGKTLYITDILLTLVNSGAVTGRLEIYDALTAVGLPKLPINAADPGSGGDDTLTTFTHTFVEPMAFGTGVYFDESAGTLVMSGVLIGYEE
jgi:hypothetical protein